MGMFDYVRCEVPLPDGWEPNDLLQTKDFDFPYLERYTIRSDGRLIHNKPRYDITPSDEVCGDIDINLHGYLRFYGIEGESNDPNSRWHAYRAKFPDGKLVHIELVENRLLAAPEVPRPS